MILFVDPYNFRSVKFENIISFLNDHYCELYNLHICVEYILYCCILELNDLY